MIFLWVFSCWGAIIYFIVRNNMRGNALKKRVAKLEAQLNPKKEDPTEQTHDD